jgi:hypothetical protein
MYVVERAHNPILQSSLRPAPHPEPQAADQLAATMRLVKAARFNAAERSRNRSSPSIL